MARQTHDKEINMVTIAVEDITWKCGDCGNLYLYHVTSCPNIALDEALARQRAVAYWAAQETTSTAAHSRKNTKKKKT